jgi:hypothetical protein
MQAFRMLFAGASLAALAGAVAAAPLRVDVNQLMNDDVALHGVTVTTASSTIKVGKWSVSATQSFAQDNRAPKARGGAEVSVSDLKQKMRRGFQDVSVSAQGSYNLPRKMKLDLTLVSTIPMGGPFGTNRIDSLADAMLTGNLGPKASYWVGVSQHLRMADPAGARDFLREIYGGFSRDFTHLTSLSWEIYRAQSEQLRTRGTNRMTMTVNHQLPDLGSVKLTASQSKDALSNDKRASVELTLDKLPF